MYKYSDVYTNLYTFVCIYACPVYLSQTAIAPQLLVCPPGPNKYCRRRSDSDRQGLTTKSFGSSQQQATTAMPIDDTASLFVHHTLPVVIAAHVRKSGRRQRLILN